MTSEDLLQPGHVVKERWKVVFLIKKKSFPLIIAVIFKTLTGSKKDRWRWIWGNLRGTRFNYKGTGCFKSGICSATQASIKNGSSSP